MLAFVHLHKTAGTTLSSILKNSFGASHCTVYSWSKNNRIFSADDFRRLSRLYPHLQSLSGHHIKAYSDLDSVCSPVEYYTFLRNPLDRCASQYQYEVQVGGGRRLFAEWIQRPENQNYQTREIVGEVNLDKAIALLERKFMFVGLMGSFDESLLLFQHAVGANRLRRIHYHHKLVAPDNTIKKQLLSDPVSLRLLLEYNQQDMALYSYVVSEIYPRQQAAYGISLAADVAAFKAENARIASVPNMLKPNYMRYSVKWWLVYQPALRLSRRLSVV